MLEAIFTGALVGWTIWFVAGLIGAARKPHERKDSLAEAYWKRNPPPR